MWKLLILVQCTTLMGTELPQGTPLRPEETWKSLDNPRNRDLFFRTLMAYFSGRQFALGKFPDTFSVNNDKSNPVSFYLEPAASAFSDYEEKKSPFANYLRS